ncbi:hypothetical protein AAG906_036990 [Vitis piasezkii]
MFAHIPSLQLVTNLPDSNKRGAKGHVLVRGPWAGLLEHPERDFCPNNSLKLPSSHKRGRLVEWVEKASFDRLNKLFEITAIERHHQTLLSARNLLAVVREPQPYVLNIFPRRLPKVVVPWEHFVLKDLPFYEKAREEDAKACQERLDQREEKSRSGSPTQVLEDNSIVNDPEEEEDMNDLRTRFLERHRKWLHEGLSREGSGGSVRRASPLNVLYSDEAGPSAVAAIQPDAAVPSNAPTAEEEARGTKAGLDVAVARELRMRRVIQPLQLLQAGRNSWRC